MKSIESLKDEGINLIVQSDVSINESSLNKQIEFNGILNSFNIDFLAPLFVGKLSSLSIEIQRNSFDYNYAKAVVSFENTKYSLPFCDFPVSLSEQKLDLNEHTKYIANYIYNHSLLNSKNYKENKDIIVGNEKDELLEYWKSHILLLTQQTKIDYVSLSNEINNFKAKLTINKKGLVDELTYNHIFSNVVNFQAMILQKRP